MSAFRAGWAEVNLTPEKKVHLCGQFCERISEYVETPVYATALALDMGEENVVFCACDLVATDLSLLYDVREKLAEILPEFDSNNLILSATHTHTSVQYEGSNIEDAGATLSILKKYAPDNVKYADPLPADETVMSDREARFFLRDRIAEAVAQAWNNKKPAKFANEFGRAAVGMCRRAKYDDKSAAMWGDTNTSNFDALESGNDSGVELLYFFDEAGKLTGVIANIACPAQAVQHRNFVSSDFWGKCKTIIREQLGEDIFLLPLCSPAGCQCPVDLIRWVEPESDLHDPNISRNNPPKRKADPSMFDVVGSWKAGRRIAHEIIDALPEAQAEMTDAFKLEHRLEMTKLPVRKVTKKDRQDAIDALDKFFAANAGKTLSFYDNASMHVHAGTLARFDWQQTHHIFEYEAHFVRLNNMVFATNPFELFLDYGNRIRAQSPAEQTFLIQLANGSMGYLPTERAEEGSHYSAYVSSGLTGHVGGDILVRETLDTFQKMFKD